MGAFFLLRDADATGSDTRREAMLAAFARQGFGAPRQFAAAGCAIYLYDKLTPAPVNAYSAVADSFCLSVGTFFYRGQIGRDALREFYTDFDPAAIPWDDIAGQFCLIVAKDGAVHVLRDRIGLFKTYHGSDESIVTSSFLAAVAATPRLTIDWQSVYEYVLLGASYGDRTIFHEIVQLKADALLSIRRAGISWRELPAVPHEMRDASFEELLEVNLSILRRYFAMLAAAFGNRISTALSSGYDSRLMLALLRACGVAPYVYVYGAADDCDVQVARQIAAGESFTIVHTDKRAAARVDRSDFAAIVDANFHFFDGAPYMGVLDDGSDLRTRRERCQNGELVLNGIGGEIYRRPDVANRPYSALEVVWRYTCGFDPGVCTPRFQPAAYCQAMADKLKRTLRASGDLVSRADVTWRGSTFYHRYWAGGTATVNNRLSPALLPFCDLAILRGSVQLPIAYRYYGTFQAALIRAADPRLAAYPSRYGHDFTAPLPLDRVVAEWRSTVLPPIYYRFRARPQAEHPYYLGPDYIAAVVDGSFPYLRRYFHLDRVCDANQYNRICTLEYLFQKYSPYDT